MRVINLENNIESFDYGRYDLLIGNDMPESLTRGDTL